MGHEQASRIVQAPGIETNQDESARPPIVRHSIGDEDTGYFSENRKRDNAVLNAATERSGAASFQILPPKQAEVFRTPKECHTASTLPLQEGILIHLTRSSTNTCQHGRHHPAHHQSLCRENSPSGTDLVFWMTVHSSHLHLLSRRRERGSAH